MTVDFDRDASRLAETAKINAADPVVLRSVRLRPSIKIKHVQLRRTGLYDFG